MFQFTFQTKRKTLVSRATQLKIRTAYIRHKMTETRDRQTDVSLSRNFVFLFEVITD